MEEEILDIQTVINEDGLDALNEDGTVENINATEVTEGIGGINFTMRTSKPGAGNKCYIRKANGGWSNCIAGKPTDAECNVLANCVGYACGRFNEIYNEITGNVGMKYNTLCCNAENFIERAQQAGLQIGMEPKVGAIACWQKGATLGSNDGPGHVAIVEQVYDNNHIYTSESGYGSNAFWNQHRYNTNGRWGCNANYKFRGFIYNPVAKEEVPQPAPQPEIIPGPSSKFNIGDKVVINGALYSNANADVASGTINNKVTNITRKAEGTKHPYNTTGDLGWMDEASISLYVAPAPVVDNSLKVGDNVKIVGYGNGSSTGKAGKAGGIGWTRQILKIYAGRPYPYMVGNKGGVTGYYKESALQKR